MPDTREVIAEREAIISFVKSLTRLNSGNPNADMVRAETCEEVVQFIEGRSKVDDSFADVNLWGIYFDPPCGCPVERAAELTIQSHKFDKYVRGFVFNDTVVRVDDEDTVKSLLKQYHSKRGGRG